MKVGVAEKGVLAVAGAAAVACAAGAALGAGPDAVRAAMVPVTLVKVALVGLAGGWALAVRRSLEAGHRAAGAWRLLGLGLAGLALGHLALGAEQLLLADPPYPGASDAIFSAGQALLALALASFVRAHRASGLFPDAEERRARAIAASVAAAVGLALLVTILRLPIPWLVRAVDGLYALLDLAVLVPLALLVHQTRRLGGTVGRVWSWLLAGFLCFSMADVALGYASALHTAPPLLLAQLPFLAAYGLIAVACRRQLGLVEG